MDENKSNNFLDKNTLMAIVLSVLFFVGWQAFLQKKYPEAYKPKDEKTQVVTDQNQESAAKEKGSSETLSEEEKEKMLSSQATPDQVYGGTSRVVEKVYDLFGQNWEIKLTNKGMGLKTVSLNKYTDRKDKNIVFQDPKNQVDNYATTYNGKTLYFNVEKRGENTFVGTVQVAGQTIVKEMIFNEENYTVLVSVKTLSGSANSNDTIETKIVNKALKVKSSMFTPAYEGTEFFTISEGSEERDRIDVEENYKETFKNTTLTSIGSQYFAVAVSDNSGLIPSTNLNYDKESQGTYATMVHQAASGSGKTKISYTGYVGPKKYDILKNLEPNFVQMINYGIFSVLSKPMLKMLKYLYGIFHNWGLAIILLTIFIRILLLPINVSSLRSMKKMQKIQPQLKAIKEKFKDDPQRVNQETMTLMKKEKANPLGGCLPMLLQLPVFFALYSVLGQSVELYKSPFIFWIKDLSYQDPFFVLPVSVGALYFIQMSLTPQPTDAAQAKVMKFIPILFCFFMITVPSGLTLYFFVNTIFGIGQTFIFQREKKKAAA